MLKPKIGELKIQIISDEKLLKKAKGQEKKAIERRLEYNEDALAAFEDMQDKQDDFETIFQGADLREPGFQIAQLLF